MPRLRPLEVARDLEEKNLRGASQPSPTTEFTAEVAAHRNNLLAEAERIIGEHFDEFPTERWLGAIRNYFNAEELAVFDALHWSKEDLTKEVGRMSGVRQWQQAAGTCADRQAARERLEVAEAALTDEVTGEAALASQMQELQRQLAILRRTRSAAAADVERQQQAVEKLRKLIPKHVEHRVARLKHGFQPQNAILQSARARLRCIADLRGIDVLTLDGKRAASLAAQSACPQAVRDISDPAEPYLSLTEWKKFLTSLDSEVAELQAEVTELSKAQAETEASIQAATDFYAQ